VGVVVIAEKQAKGLTGGEHSGGQVQGRLLGHLTTPRDRDGERRGVRGEEEEGE
jgi:hypothetical protein